VTATAHADVDAPRAAESHRATHIRWARASSDDRRPPIDHRVPDPAGLVVASFTREQDLSFETASKVSHVRGTRVHSGLVVGVTLLGGQTIQGGSSILFTDDPNAA
jgi:hypothetical protein